MEKRSDEKKAEPHELKELKELAEQRHETNSRSSSSPLPHPDRIHDHTSIWMLLITPQPQNLASHLPKSPLCFASALV